jgi:hypothetical protein
VVISVRFVVVARCQGARTVDAGLPGIPFAGDVIELADGTRCRVQGVVRATSEDSSVSHYVYATTVEPSNGGDT